ncbi:precorrin-2 C(20)-methyltransferase [Alkalimarinus sediminis]|uniref:Precorrin-2 C(20)-methyltransferase n=1 Tax=Alkalimarinus sediminis TaxID=1632866 RepID=A0A9E8HW11_9ALTE|nr:precorrin-2 C(20)-methyltransferase [Alkalimarinus sediminis]UZW76889.1 precorrin-2 C(20)-methyltransferase [Alkalimarinus sediminis]
MNNHPAAGTFYGVGVGPGDPELITLKAAKLISRCDVICYLCNDADSDRPGRSQSKDIAQDVINDRASKAIEIAIPMPYSRDRTAANKAYDQGAKAIKSALEQGQSVVFLCEGDPLFFGSYAYLQERLCEAFTCLSIPGISSPNAASAVAGIPLTMQKENYAVLSGRLSDEKILNHLREFDSLVLMKVGQSRPRLLALLKESGRIHETVYVEYATREQQKIVYDVTTLGHEAGPYFSLFIITRHQRNV